MDELVGLLTRERLLLDRVLFRATELRLVLGTDPRFVAWAAADMTKASDALRDAELRRAMVWNALALERGWPVETFDWELITDSSEEPYTTILKDLREALAASTVELRGQLDVIRQLGTSGLSGVSDMLERLASPEALAKASGTLGPASRWQPAAGNSRIDFTL